MLMPVGSTSWRSVQESGFAEIGLLTPPCRLYPLAVRQASALPAASSRFRLATDTLAVQLTLPLAGCVGDFHPQVSPPCRAHQNKRPDLTDPAVSKGVASHTGYRTETGCRQNPPGIISEGASRHARPHPRRLVCAAIEWPQRVQMPASNRLMRRDLASGPG